MRHLLVCNALGFESLFLDHANVPARGVDVGPSLRQGTGMAISLQQLLSPPKETIPVTLLALCLISPSF